MPDTYGEYRPGSMPKIVLESPPPEGVAPFEVLHIPRGYLLAVAADQSSEDRPGQWLRVMVTHRPDSTLIEVDSWEERR